MWCLGETEPTEMTSLALLHSRLDTTSRDFEVGRAGSTRALEYHYSSGLCIFTAVSFLHCSLAVLFIYCPEPNRL